MHNAGMKRIVFYSWQSDLPNATNRGFIQQALETAAEKIASDKSVEIEPVVDRDTQGVSGSPEIASTIFAKLAAADVVIADVSIIQSPRKGRPTPNPNVLVELGYALRAVGPDRVLMIFNDAYGKITDLPFDLRMRRLITYTQQESGTDRATGRKQLAATLETAIRHAFAASQHVQAISEVDEAVTAIENGELRGVGRLRRALGACLVQFDALRPRLPRESGTIEELLAGIDEAKRVVIDVARLSDVISLAKSEDAAAELYRWFGNILERYDLPKEFSSGHYNRADFDYFKFVGYEMFTNFVGQLLRDKRWEILDRLLRESIPMAYRRQLGGPGTVLWDGVSDYMPLLMHEGEQKGRLSLPADIAHEHHNGPMGALVSWNDFLAADLFLFLRTMGPQPPNGGDNWRPWSVLYLSHAPIYLSGAESKAEATALAQHLGADGIDGLKALLTEGREMLRRMFVRGHIGIPLYPDDIKRIGSRP